MPGSARRAKARREGLEDWRLQIGNPDGGTDGNEGVAGVEAGSDGEAGGGHEAVGEHAGGERRVAARRAEPPVAPAVLVIYICVPFRRIIRGLTNPIL